MSRDDLFVRILSSLHKGVFDDGLWPEITALMDEYCGSKGSFVVVGDGATDDDVDIFFSRFCFGGERDAALERLYFETYHAIDERLPRIRCLPDGKVVHVSSLFAEEEKRTSVVYNEALPTSDTANSLCVRLDGPEGSRIVWVVADPVSGKSWSGAQVEGVERLLPHLRQFVRVRQALIDARALGASASALLDNARTAVIGLDRRGRVMAASDRAGALLAKRDGLRDEAGYLRASLLEEDEHLQRLLAQALPFRGGAGASGSMLVSRAQSRVRLVVHVNPVSADGTGARTGRLGALVLVVDPLGHTGVDLDRVGGVLGLTRAEADLAALLAQGKTVREVALATSRSETTVRWHLRQIYAKHELSRQAQLVQLVASVTDFTGTGR